LSNFISSNRILKSSQVVFDKGNTIAIKHETYEPVQGHGPELDEFDFFLNPGNVYEHDIRKENSEIQEEELAERIVSRAKEEAARMIEAAREDAELILDRMEVNAQESIQRMEEAARQKGYEEGYAKGEAESETLKKEAHAIYEKSVQHRQQSFEAIETDIVELIIDVLNKLLSDMVEINPQIILYLIRKGFAESKSSGRLIVRVSEADYELAQAKRETLMQYIEAGTNLDVVKDNTLRKADCIIETPFGMIDCSLDQQFEVLKKSLYFICENR